MRPVAYIVIDVVDDEENDEVQVTYAAKAPGDPSSIAYALREVANLIESGAVQPTVPDGPVH